MKTESPVRVLQVTIGDGSFGGVASFLYSYYSHMDHSRVHFDFLYCGENSMLARADDSVLADSEITTLHILKKNNNGMAEYKKLLPALKHFFDTHEYDIVHVNSGNAYLNACIAHVIKGKAVYIAHSHSAAPTIVYGSKKKQAVKQMIKGSIQSYIIKRAKALYACSEHAGENLFGKKGIALSKFKVVKNAIDVGIYSYKEDVRKKVRDDDNKIVLGFVGRLADEKNPVFAVEVFNDFFKNRSDSELWMIGDGDLKSAVSKRVIELGVENNVKLMGYRSDVADLMQGMDALIFPSIYEGLGIVAIEAQCCGLPVIASDTIPRDVNLTGTVEFLPLSEKTSIWAERVAAALKESSGRIDKSEVIISSHYDIGSAARDLQLEYEKLCGRR